MDNTYSPIDEAVRQFVLENEPVWEDEVVEKFGERGEGAVESLIQSDTIFRSEEGLYHYEVRDYTQDAKAILERIDSTKKPDVEDWINVLSNTDYALRVSQEPLHKTYFFDIHEDGEIMMWNLAQIDDDPMNWTSPGVMKSKLEDADEIGLVVKDW